jgi:hypothetical protein
MESKFGLISSDSHGQLDKDAYTMRMSAQRWGDRIPHVVEIKESLTENGFVGRIFSTYKVNW